MSIKRPNKPAQKPKEIAPNQMKLKSIKKQTELAMIRCDFFRFLLDFFVSCFDNHWPLDIITNEISYVPIMRANKSN